MNYARIEPKNAGILRLGVVGLLMFLCAAELGSESFVLTTYYPAPSGVYKKLITTRDTVLARDGGIVKTGGNIDLTTHKIVNLAVPVDANDAATKAYVDAAGGGKAVYSSKCGWEYGYRPYYYFGSASCAAPGCASGFSSVSSGCIGSAGFGEPSAAYWSMYGYCQNVCVQN